jgi:cytochrome b6-f complex iron-sulfur subunit
MPGVAVGCSDSTSVDHGTIAVNVASLDAAGKGLRSQLPDGTPIMVVRSPSGMYVTLQLICQHLGCKGNSLQLTGQMIECGCHGSQYDLGGKVIKGPAKKNLVTYKTTYDAAKSEVRIDY